MESCKLFTVYVDGNDRIYSITLRKDIEDGVSTELIAEMCANQVAQFGLPEIEKHIMPESFSGEVWQYGWGKAVLSIRTTTG